MRMIWTRKPRYSSAVRSALLLSLSLALAWGLVGCEPTGQGTTTPLPTVTAPVTVSASVSGLPTLAPEKGWHTVLEVGNMVGGVQNTGGSFIATKPYTIFFTCRGAGLMKVAYGAATQTMTQTAPCTATPEVNGAHGSPPTSGSQQVQVQVSTTGQVTWKLLVEMQD
jgi:hypothetical protein